MSTGSQGIQSAPLPIWQELLVGIEMLYLRVSPIYWGWGIPPGDGSAVVVVPAFLGTDFYLAEFRSWLSRIGYRPFSSGIGSNTDCPNLLIRLFLEKRIQAAYRATGRRKVHLIGHSLGGIIARAAATQMPDRVASVISLGSPVQRLAIHSSVLKIAEYVRKQILERNGERVTPDCYTPACTCHFAQCMNTSVPDSVRQTLVYTKADGVVDWEACRLGDPATDVEVSATHLGMVFSPIVYQAVAERLAAAQVRRRKEHVERLHRSAA